MELAHVAITVPDLDQGVAWYAEALGLRPLPGRVESHAAAHPRVGEALAAVYDEACAEVRVAFLVDPRGIAVELFEFDGGGEPRPGDWEFRRQGPSHVGFLVEDLEPAAARIVAAGGRRRSRAMAAGGDGAWRFCFCEDPWGTVIELQTHTQEEMYGAG